MANPAASRRMNQWTWLGHGRATASVRRTLDFSILHRYIVFRYMSRGLLNGPERAANGELALVKKDYEALASFRYALRRFFHFSQQAVLAEDLTLQQHQSLLAIKAAPGHEALTVGELAEQMFIKHHSAVGLVDRLEQQGLVQRQTSATDRRQVWITLTGRGEKVLSRLAMAHRDELRQLSPKLRKALEQITESGV